MTSPAPPRRRWFRFSLRTFFVVLTLFCVWLGVQVKWIHDRHEALKSVHQAGYDARSYKPAPWSLRFIERGVPFIVVEPEFAESSEKVSELKRLFPEATIYTPRDGLPMAHPHHQSYISFKTL